ncbi:MAG TPA: 3-oxoacyl-ACP reductase family protein [Thermoanaerobaculia bacterium]|nr:3-oxoacyl-ACP reductase family protein [Thermoanaerobaculia bacterium]
MSEGERRRVALVTGASRGIGRAIAARLAADGFHTVLTYRADAAGAEAAVASIAVAGGKAEAVKTDAASREETADLLERLEKEHEGVDVLVNNAAVLKNGLFALMPEASWNLVMETALGGTFRATKGVIRNMIRRRWGRIVNVSSLAAYSGSAGQTNYSAAKGAIVSFTKSLAAEVGAYGITVNAIAPGFVETEMISFIGAEARTDFLKRIPMQRFGAPEDIAPLVSFLCTDGASYLTGQTIRVDGGFVG